MKPMLAKSFDGEQNINGWLMSEKLDGVRAIWTGTGLLSRNGNRFHAPVWFTAQLPAGVMLDGELFIARGKFQATVGIVKKQSPVDAEWRAISFRVFDAPEASGGFESRLGFCLQVLRDCAVASVVAHATCENRAALETFFAHVLRQGGEGVMLRRPGSAYESRRSPSLLKYKPFDSAEAEMIGQEAGQGKHAGAVGALVLKWRDIIFKVGTGLTDELRAAPPAIGSLITFGFCGLTDAGVPRFPTFLTTRDYE